MDFCPINKKPCPHARVVHVTDLNDGHVTEQHLCEKCSEQIIGEDSLKKAVEKQKSIIPPGLLTLMQAILANPLFADSSQLQKPSYPPCPKCETTTNDIVKSGKFGCAECYIHFGRGAENIVSRAQGAMQHVGKVPKRWASEQANKQEQIEITLDKNEQIKNLKLKMKKAIEVENYEVAGVLKKKIEELQQ